MEAGSLKFGTHTYVLMYNIKQFPKTSMWYCGFYCGYTSREVLLSK